MSTLPRKQGQQQTQQQGMGWGDILRTLGVPLGAAIAGSVNPNMLAGAAGLGQGYVTGQQQQFENELATQEQERKNNTVFGGFSEIPEGFEIIGYDQSGRPMVRKLKRDVQGEKFDLETQEKKTQQDKTSSFIKESALDSLKTIEEVEKGINNFGLTGAIPSIPGTERRNWEANVDKLISGKIVDLITEMKQASKTGATGFGQLNLKELEVLKNASTALKRTLSPEDARRYINDMKSSLKKVVGENETRTVNGVNYQRSQDGKWHRVK